MDGATGSEEPLHILRAKYHDYCSAQVADLLVYMSPDDIYLLAERARREEAGDDAVPYAEVVRIATEWLSRRDADHLSCLLYTSPSPRDRQKSRMPSSA